MRSGYESLSLIDHRKEQSTPRLPEVFTQSWKDTKTQTYRGEFLDEVMGHMHQVLIFLHVLLEAPALLLLQQVEVISCIQQGLYQALPGAECGDLGGHGGADPCADHQHQLRGSLGLQTGQQFPVGGPGRD